MFSGCCISIRKIHQDNTEATKGQAKIDDWSIKTPVVHGGMSFWARNSHGSCVVFSCMFGITDVGKFVGHLIPKRYGTLIFSRWLEKNQTHSSPCFLFDAYIFSTYQPVFFGGGVLDREWREETFQCRMGVGEVWMIFQIAISADRQCGEIIVSPHLHMCHFNHPLAVSCRLVWHP